MDECICRWGGCRSDYPLSAESLDGTGDGKGSVGIARRGLGTTCAYLVSPLPVWPVGFRMGGVSAQ